MHWLLIVLACTGRTPAPAEPAPEPPTAVEAPAPTPVDERIVLTLDPKYLTVDEAAGVARYEPDSDRQMAAYTHYLLDLASLREVVGGDPTEPVDVAIAVDERTEETRTPEDPNLPSPEGGFAITTITGKVVR